MNSRKPLLGLGDGCEMHISIVGEIIILASHMSEIRPEKGYSESSAICPNEMHYGTQSVVGNASVSIR